MTVNKEIFFYVIFFSLLYHRRYVTRSFEYIKMTLREHSLALYSLLKNQAMRQEEDMSDDSSLFALPLSTVEEVENVEDLLTNQVNSTKLVGIEETSINLFAKNIVN